MISASRLAHDLAARLAPQRTGPISVMATLHGVGGAAMDLLQNKQPHIAPLLGLCSEAESGAALLELWRLPDNLWRTVSHLELAEYLVPAEIPEDCRAEVCFFRVAHACDEYLANRGENALADSLTSAYLRAIGAPQRNIADLVAQTLLPALRKARFHITSPLHVSIRWLYFPRTCHHVKSSNSLFSRTTSNMGCQLTSSSGISCQSWTVSQRTVSSPSPSIRTAPATFTSFP